MTNKNKYCLALATLLLASCSNEDVFRDAPGGSGTDGRHEVRLTIPGVGSGAVPYSLATESENKLEDFDVYVFGLDTVYSSGNYLLEEVFRSRSGLTLADQNKDKTATIQLKGTNAKRIYYVANSYRGNQNMASLDSVELNKTTTTEFRLKLTDPIPVHLSTPLLMTDSSVIADPVAITALDVNLKRSMARFDIINDTYDTEFTIEQVQVEKARSYAYIFPQSPAYAAPLIDKMERIDFTALPNANKGETNSVFYMYPTVTDGEASVSLIGMRAGAKVIYPVKFEDKDQNAIPIEANKRYMIEVLSSSVAYIDAKIRVIDWFVGDTINGESGDGTIKLSLNAAAGGAGVFNDNTLVIPAADGTEVVMDVECDSEWEFATADLPEWIIVDTTGYSLNKVAKSFKLTTTKANPSGLVQRMGTVTLRNVRYPAITQPLVVKQEVNADSSIDPICSRLAGNALRLTGATDSAIVEVQLGGTTVPTSYTYDVTGANTTWLIVSTSALKATTSDKYLKFKTTPNTTNDTLRATVTLTTDGGLEQILTVTQAPQVLDLIAKASGLRNGKLELGGDAKDVEVSIEAATGEGWAVTKENVTGADADWLTFDKTTSTGADKFEVKAAENKTGATRSVRVTVSYDNRPDIRQVFLVTQESVAVEHTIAVDRSTIAIEADGQMTDYDYVTVTTTPTTDTWEAVISGNTDNGTDWVTMNVTSGANGEAITLTAGVENTDSAPRTATITITSKEDASKTATVTITQAGATQP